MSREDEFNGRLAWLAGAMFGVGISMMFAGVFGIGGTWGALSVVIYGGINAYRSYRLL